MSTIERERRRHIPEIPTTIAEVDINGRWRLTADRRRFLSKLENGWGIAVFATEEVIECIGQCDNNFMDGTFKSVPRPYTQLLTIHGFYRDRVIPLVFALMVDRHVGSYRQIFGHIRRKYSRITHNQLLPVNIITDFETGLINAAETVSSGENVPRLKGLHKLPYEELHGWTIPSGHLECVSERHGHQNKQLCRM
jgi:hypothetical protein